MEETLLSRISRLLADPTVCRVLRPLIYYFEGCSVQSYSTQGFSLASLANHICRSEEETRQTLIHLRAVGLVEFATEHDKWTFAGNNEFRSLIDKSIFQFELDWVRDRAQHTNHHAWEKIEMIDELADHIAVARLYVRS